MPVIKTVYVDLVKLNDLQSSIMVFVEDWVHIQKTPIPQKEIIKAMKKRGVVDYTCVNAINALIRKGFIRRAVTITNRTFYVLLRTR